MNIDGEWLRLPEQDIASLRGLGWAKMDKVPKANTWTK
jgi:hypothetical protein